jgi:hypothetical protein
MASAAKFNIFVKDLAEKKHDLSADNLKVVLTNTAPTAANALLSDITDLSTGGGYTAGGAQATLVSSTQTSGTYTLKLNNVTTTATGAVGPFRYAVLYNSTQTSPLKPLILSWDYGSAVTLANGDTFTVTFDSTNGVLTLA